MYENMNTAWYSERCSRAQRINAVAHRFSCWEIIRPIVPVAPVVPVVRIPENEIPVPVETNEMMEPAVRSRVVLARDRSVHIGAHARAVNIDETQ